MMIRKETAAIATEMFVSMCSLSFYFCNKVILKQLVFSSPNLQLYAFSSLSLHSEHSSDRAEVFKKKNSLTLSRCQPHEVFAVNSEELCNLSERKLDIYWLLTETHFANMLGTQDVDLQFEFHASNWRFQEAKECASWVHVCWKNDSRIRTSPCQ